eukprot:10635855-Ditylum_brightwellii.AAC.1
MYHEREDRFCKSKNGNFSSGKAKSRESLSDRNNNLHAIIKKEIAAALSLQEKRDLNKFEALSTSSGRDDGNNSSIISR